MWEGIASNLTPFGHGANALSSAAWVFRNHITAPETAHNVALDLAYHFGAGAILAFAVATGTMLCRSIYKPIFAAFLILGLYTVPFQYAVGGAISALVMGHLARDWPLAWRNCNLRGLAIIHRIAHA